MNNAQLINQTSGEVEYYTPAEIVDAARRAMGGIDLDPASSEIANQRVRAESIFDASDDGLTKMWWGRVWMNHPFGRRINRSHEKWVEICAQRGVSPDVPFIPGNAEWINKIEYEWFQRNIDAACCITYACTSEAWFQPLMWRPQCYLTPRTNYYLPDGSIKPGVTKGSVVTYYGDNIDAFVEAFAKLGVIKVPYVGTGVI